MKIDCVSHNIFIKCNCGKLIQHNALCQPLINEGKVMIECICGMKMCLKYEIDIKELWVVCPEKN